MLDYLIANARIIDPASSADFHGSVGIKGAKIDGVYSCSQMLPPAVEIIDAQGGILCPGFIDIHAHSENNVSCAEKLLAMGVTTAISGNCGHSTADFRGFFDKYSTGGYPVNQLEQAGHSILRGCVGQCDRKAPASNMQIEKMKSLAAQAFADGACGLSFGLEYSPGASTHEVIEVARTAAEAGRFISIHARINNGNEIECLREALDLAVITGAPVIYSHLVFMHQGQMLKEALRIITEYRNRGADIRVDSGMYTAYATLAGALSFDENIFLNNESMLMCLRAATGKYAGQILDRGKYIEMRTLHPRDSLIYDPGDNTDVFVAYSLPDVMVSTDCTAYPAGQGHPQGAATYPYFLRLLAKEREQFSMLEAVNRCTLLPAKAAGLQTKGRIECGMDADLVVLDWEHLREHAAFPGMGDPGAPPSGIRHVFVNGQPAICNEKRREEINSGYCIKR